jgi:hypothetical protein
MSGDKFVLFDSGIYDLSRIIITGDESLLSFARNSKIALCDGTFKSTPPEFYQIFTIHFEIFEAIVPIFYVYMKSKEEKDYIRVLQSVVNIVGDMKLKFLVVDFEKAIENAFKFIFKELEFSTVYFISVKLFTEKYKIKSFRIYTIRTIGLEMILERYSR